MAQQGGGSNGVDEQENLGGGASDVKQQLLSRLLGSGMLNSVKAHLRATLFAELKGSDLNSALAPAPSPTLQQHVLNCLVAEYLLAQQYKYTLSVFLAESGTHKLPQLSHADLLRLVGVAAGSRVHTLLLARAGSGCLASGIVEALSHMESCAPTATTGCQTDEQPAASAQLLARLEQIEDEYRQRSREVEAQSAQSLEARVAECQRECEARAAVEVQAQVARVREVELVAVRDQEAAKYAQLLAAKREVLQQSYQERLDKLHAQEEEQLDKARREQRRLDRQREEDAQRLRTEEERLRAWREQEEAGLVAKAAEVRRRLQEAERLEGLAAERRQEAEGRLEEQHQAQQRALNRREEDLRQQQAALDVEREQLERRRTDLAVHAAEAESLRRQLAAQSEAHVKETKFLQQERERLHERLQQLQAEFASSAARKAPGASATAPQPDATTLLQQRAQLQQEVAVCRARERLWRESTSSSERLLEKASRWDERALQHAEELRLALAAAVREVADLQHQAQLAAAEASGPLVLALQSAACDAQKWRDAALAKLDAASQEEARLRQDLARLQQRAAANRLSAAQGLQGLLSSYGPCRGVAAPPALAPAAVTPAAVTHADEASASEGKAGPQPEEVQAQALLQGYPSAAKQASQAQAATEGSSDGSSDGGSSPESSPSQSCRQPRASRATSDILAAYRARQQQAAQQAAAQAAPTAAVPRCPSAPPPGPGTAAEWGAAAARTLGSAMDVVPSARRRSASFTPNDEDAGCAVTAAEQQPGGLAAAHGEAPVQHSESTNASEKEEGEDGEDYYISELSSENSKF